MKRALLFLTAIASFAHPAIAQTTAQSNAQTIAITGGKLVIGDGSAPIDGGTVIVRDGNIVAAGAGVAVPAGALRIDATGKWVTPGIFAGFSRLGLSEVDAVSATNDKSAGAAVLAPGWTLPPPSIRSARRLRLAVRLASPAR